MPSAALLYPEIPTMITKIIGIRKPITNWALIETLDFKVFGFVLFIDSFPFCR